MINQPEFLELLAEFGRYRGGDVHQATESDLVEEIKVIQRTDFPRYLREGWDKKLASLEEKRAARSRVPQEGPRPGDAKREAEIVKAMRRDFKGAYLDKGLDREYAAILARRGA